MRAFAVLFAAGLFTIAAGTAFACPGMMQSVSTETKTVASADGKTPVVIPTPPKSGS